MRRNSPRTKRADDVRRFAVMYEAVRYVEATREHIAQAEGGEPANS